MGNPMTDADLAAIEARCERATEGPWEWYGNTKTHDCNLATTHSGRVFVMGFDRWGMQSAQPTFQVRRENGGGVMEPVTRFAKYEASYRSDFIGLDHPDAAFIAHARTDLPALLAEVRRLRRGIAEIENLAGDTEVNESKTCDLVGRYARNLLAGREWSEGE